LFDAVAIFGNDGSAITLPRVVHIETPVA
jgi:hypothetical protein